MTYQTRYLSQQIAQDLKRKMVFVGGPRQIGKTTLAKQFLPTHSRAYFNWDYSEQRERILKQELPNEPLWVFDELHKYRQWRQYIKGLYDIHGDNHQILVTGSARLDYYRRGGDSLQGRYYYLRLHPFSVAELCLESTEDLLILLELSGFPEPFLSQSSTEAKRWSRDYRQRLIQEDLLSLERVHDLGSLELLMLRLPALVGSPLSINAIRQDLQVSHKAVSQWITILERLYAVFRLSPFGAPSIRAVKKEQKHYHYDWSLVIEKGLRFENLVASHLLKWVHFEQDTKGRELALRFFRDIDGREVDFIILENDQPIIAIECKWSDSDITKGLKYFHKRFPNCDCWQISAIGEKDYLSGEGIRVCPGISYLKTLI